MNTHATLAALALGLCLAGCLYDELAQDSKAVEGDGEGTVNVVIYLNNRPVVESVHLRTDGHGWVAMDVTVTDPDGDALDYEWTMVGDAEAVFDPSAEVEDPTVWITAQESVLVELECLIRDGRGGEVVVEAGVWVWLE